jgi:hypothetical protein
MRDLFEMVVGTLFEKAKSAAQDAFDTDDSGRNADKVCAVGIHIASDAVVTMFSGSPGYKTLVDRYMQKNATSTKSQAQQGITHTLTAFLKSEIGGGFTLEQINKEGIAAHGRGAMNCAEPKLYYYIRHIKNDKLEDWIIIPFNNSQAGLVHNPPCGNCRSWAYRVFHPRSAAANGL